MVNGYISISQSDFKKVMNKDKDALSILHRIFDLRKPFVGYVDIRDEIEISALFLGTVSKLTAAPDINQYIVNVIGGTEVTKLIFDIED